MELITPYCIIMDMPSINVMYICGGWSSFFRMYSYCNCTEYGTTLLLKSPLVESRTQFGDV